MHCVLACRGHVVLFVLHTFLQVCPLLIVYVHYACCNPAGRVIQVSTIIDLAFLCMSHSFFFLLCVTFFFVLQEHLSHLGSGPIQEAGPARAQQGVRSSSSSSGRQRQQSSSSGRQRAGTWHGLAVCYQ